MSADSTLSRAKRLPPGRHGLPRDQVKRDQRRRLLTAAAECLAERGYGHVTTTEVASRAGVSTSTLYQQFDGLWACLLAVYEDAAERLCAEIEGGCEEAGGGDAPEAGIARALALLGREPALAQLLATEPPPGDAALISARNRLRGRLATLLRNARGGAGDGEREARLVGAALALVSTQARAKSAKQLRALAPLLTAVLLAP